MVQEKDQNLARCTWRGEPMHRSVRSPNGNININTRLFNVQYYTEDY